MTAAGVIAAVVLGVWGFKELTTEMPADPVALAGVGLGMMFPGLSSHPRLPVDGSHEHPHRHRPHPYDALFAKVRYAKMPTVFAGKKLLGLSLILNWVIGPAPMLKMRWCGSCNAQPATGSKAS